VRYIGFYSGLGGLDLGAELAGFEPVLQVDVNRWCYETLKTIRAKTALRADMDALVLSGSLKDYRDSIDLVVGGPPCQGFSVAGRMNPDDPRSRQVFTFLDAVRHVQPRAFIMENVPALTKPRWEYVLERLRTRVLRSGYATTVLKLNAMEFGVPQDRERMFLVGIKGDVPLDGVPPGPFLGDGITAGSVLRKLKRPIEDDFTAPSKIIPAKNPIKRASPYAGFLLNGAGRVVDLRRPSPTLPASMGGNRTPIMDLDQLEHFTTPWIEGYHRQVLQGRLLTELPWTARMRRMSVREALVIQGFDVNYPLKGPMTARYAQAGNAVPPALSEAVCKAVKAHL
jgi:DNA (cytosine-5)-methyltransferase 1